LKEFPEACFPVKPEVDEGPRKKGVLGAPFPLADREMII